MNHVKKHWIIYLFAATTIILSVMYQDIEIKLYGGLAWFVLNAVLFISAILIIVGIKGGEVSYSSNGAIPLMKKIIGGNDENNQK